MAAHIKYHPLYGNDQAGLQQPNVLRFGLLVVCLLHLKRKHACLFHFLLQLICDQDLCRSFPQQEAK
jgi:hypothetical protein